MCVLQNIGNKVTVQVGSDLDDRIISLGNANPGDVSAKPLSLSHRRLTGLCCLFFAGSFSLSTLSLFRLSTLRKGGRLHSEASFKWPGKRSRHHITL